MLGGLENAGVGLRAQGETVWATHARAEQRLDGSRDVTWIALAVLAERDRIVGRCLRDARDPRSLPAVEHGAILGGRDAMSGPVKRRQVDVRRAAIGVTQLSCGRARTARAARP